MATSKKTSSASDSKTPSAKKRVPPKPTVEEKTTENFEKDFKTENLSEDTQTKESKFFELNKNIIIIFLLLIGFGLIFYKKTNDQTSVANLKNKVVPDIVKKLINNPNTTFTVGNIKETNGLYEIELNVGPQKVTSYMTKDAKIFFAGGIKVDDLNKAPQNPTTAQPAKKLTCNDLQKAEVPKLTAFIVSKCPFGLQMQRLFKKTVSELSQISSNLDVKYIGNIVNGKITAMHGDEEAQENLRQICIREEQKEKYWPYVGCYMKEGKTDACLTETAVNTFSLNSCMTDQNKGLKYAQADFDLATKYNIGSSPTLLLNDKQTISEFDFGGRTPNAIKDIVGCSFQTKPDIFKNDLSKSEVAVSFSATDEPQAQANSAQANCGQ